MTLFNIVSVIILIALVVGCILMYRYFKREMRSADGMGEIYDKASEKGDKIANLGEKPEE